MIINGLIYGLLDTGAGIDPNGDPTPSSARWGKPTECHIAENTSERIGTVQDGAFRLARYVVYAPIEFNADRVKLKQNGVDLGDFEVKSIQWLSLVNRVKIIV